MQNEHLIVTYQALQKKEQDLLKALSAINGSFQELGIPLSALKSFEDKPQLSDQELIRQSGIRIKDKLSFRGRGKAEEYFNLLDINRDGLIGYEEFRAISSMRNEYGLITDPTYQSSDAWYTFMQNEGYKFDSSRQLSSDQFMSFRAKFEELQPIAPELRLLGLQYLPDYLLHWAKCKAVVQEVLSLRDFLKTTNRDEVEKLQGSLSLEEMLFVANNIGFAFTKPEIALLMLWRKQKANALTHLIRTYSKRNISQQEYGFLLNERDELMVKLSETELKNTIEVDDMSYVSVNQFVGWLISCPKFLNFEVIYRQLIKFKYRLHRGIRKVDSYCRFLFTFAGHINDRLIFRDFFPMNKLLKYFQDVFSIKYSFDIGLCSNNSIHNNLNGISFNWKLMKVENPDIIYKQYNFPANNIGTVFYFDLLFQSKVSTENKLLTHELMREFLVQYLEKEMKKNNANVYGVQCALTINELDDSEVLRIFVIYKKTVSIDKFLEHMLIPYRLIDLVTVFVGDFKTNVHLDEFFNHPTQSLNELFACSFSMNISTRKNIVCALLERMILAFSAGVTKEQAEFLEQSKSSNDSSTTSGPPQTKQQLLQQHKLQDMKHEERLRHDRWSRIFPHYGTIVSHCRYWYNMLSSWKNAVIFRYSYKDLDDLFRKLLIDQNAYHLLLPFRLECKKWQRKATQSNVGRSRSNIPTKENKSNKHSGKRNMQLKEESDDENDQEQSPEFQKSIIGRNWYEILHEKGYLYSLYQQFNQHFKSEFGHLFGGLKSFLEERKKEDDAKRLQDLMTIVTSEAEKEANANNQKNKDTIERLKRLGISESEQADLMEDEENFQNPADYIERVEINQRQSDILNIRLYECLKSFTIGLHTVEVISGRHKISLSTQELDIFEILPTLSNDQQPKDFLDRINQKNEHEDTMNEIFRKTLISRNLKKKSS